MNDLVSIVIPTYNRANDLKRALQSILNQTYSNWEAIVIDNHSTDNTDEIVEQFNDLRIKLFKVHNHGVIATSRNLGIKNAKGIYVAFLDSDDWWLPTKLEKSIEALSSGSDLVYHPLYLATHIGQSKYDKVTKSRSLNINPFKDLLQFGNPICNSSVVVKREVLTKVGRISTEKELMAIEDYDLWLKIAQENANFKLITESLGYYWVGGGNVSNSERVLSTIQAIENKYQQQLTNLDLKNQFTWFNYARSKTYLKMKNYKMAKEQMASLNLTGSPIDIFIKSKILYTYITFLEIWNDLKNANN